MSSQTVYFTNPSVISEIQNQAGLNPPALSANFNQNVINFFTGTYQYNPSSSGSSKGMAMIAGNAFSGEQKFASVGVARKDGGLFDPETTYFQYLSSSKIITGLGYAKLLEEGVVKSSDLVYAYVPEFAGSYKYYSSVNQSTGNPCLPNTWTGTIATAVTDPATSQEDGLESYTLADMAGLRFPLVDPFFCASTNGCYLFAENPAWYYGAYKASTASACDALSVYNVYTYTHSVGVYPERFTVAYSSGAYLNPETSILNIISDVKAGNFILSNKRTALVAGVGPNAAAQIPSYRAYYDTSLMILGLALDRACHQKLGMSFATYIRTKLFTPLEISKIYFSGIDAPPADFAAKRADYAFSRFNTFIPTFDHAYQGGVATGGANPLPSPPTVPWSWGTGSLPACFPYKGVSLGASTSYVSQGKPSQNVIPGVVPNLAAKVWNQDYPLDGLSQLTEGLYLYNATGGFDGHNPCWGTMSEFCKLLNLIVNKGKYTQSNGTVVQVLNPQSVAYLTTPKVSALSDIYAYQSDDNAVPLNFGFDAWEGDNGSWCGFFGRVNRDVVTPSLQYPLTPGTCGWLGLTSNLYYFDIETGYYMMWMIPEWGIVQGTFLNWFATPYPQDAFAVCLRS